MSKRNLERYLDRRSVPHARSLATLLLQRAESTSRWFWLKNEDLPFKDDMFTISRVATLLVETGLVTRAGDSGSDRWRFFPTARLVHYMDTTKATRANTQDIEKLKEEIALLKQGQQELWDAVRRIEADDPPVTLEKLQAHLKLVKEGE